MTERVTHAFTPFWELFSACGLSITRFTNVETCSGVGQSSRHRTFAELSCEGGITALLATDCWCRTQPAAWKRMGTGVRRAPHPLWGLRAEEGVVSHLGGGAGKGQLLRWCRHVRI